MTPLVVLGSPDVVRGARAATFDRRVIGPCSPLIGWQFTEADTVIDPGWKPTGADEWYWLQHLCAKFGPRDTAFVDEHLRPLLWPTVEETRRLAATLDRRG